MVETHEHFDPDGNLTGTTIVTRESEWDDYARSLAMALDVFEATRCPSCHNWDALVPLKASLRHVTWEQHDGRKVEVAQYRCIYCGAADLIKRDDHKRHEKDQPAAGTAGWADGRMFVARPPTTE